jgi:hypothetical protein
MGVSHDVVGKKVGMSSNETLGVKRATHIIDISFTAAIESGIITTTKIIQGPCLPVFCSKRFSNGRRWLERRSVPGKSCKNIS